MYQLLPWSEYNLDEGRRWEAWSRKQVRVQRSWTKVDLYETTRSRYKNTWLTVRKSYILPSEWLSWLRLIASLNERRLNVDVSTTTAFAKWRSNSVSRYLADMTSRGVYIGRLFGVYRGLYPLADHRCQQASHKDTDCHQLESAIFGLGHLKVLHLWNPLAVAPLDCNNVDPLMIWLRNTEDLLTLPPYANITTVR